MRISKHGIAVIACSVVLGDAALVQAQTPGEAPQGTQQPPAQAPQVPVPGKKAPTLPTLEVIAPKKKAPRPTAATKAAPAAAASAPPAAPVAPAWAGTVDVRMSPVGGSEWPIDKVPAGVSVVTATDIERTGSPSITEAINARVPGATINEALGNPLAADCSIAVSARLRSTARRRASPSTKTACV